MMMRFIRPIQHVLAIFSKQKSFLSNPVIASPLLNRLGLHVFRVVAARGIYKLRLLVLAPLVDVEDRRFFARQGYLVKRDFLSQAELESLRSEVAALEARIHETIEGDTRNQRVFVDATGMTRLPTLRDMLVAGSRTAVIRYTNSKNRLPLVFIENLLRGALPGNAQDPQSTPHRDTFHPTIKAWLFIDDVTSESGPFTYVPGSHRLTARRLRWEYARSLVARNLSDGHSEDGSFRATEEDIVTLGSSDPVRFAVPANTLVVADTSGIHWRGGASARTRRRAIWIQSRDNPFSPTLTPFPLKTRRVTEYFVKRHLTRFDASLGGGDGERVFTGRLSGG
jgi:hypothetical protein